MKAKLKAEVIKISEGSRYEENSCVRAKILKLPELIGNDNIDDYLERFQRIEKLYL